MSNESQQTKNQLLAKDKLEIIRFLKANGANVPYAMALGELRKVQMNDGGDKDKAKTATTTQDPIVGSSAWNLQQQGNKLISLGAGLTVPPPVTNTVPDVQDNTQSNVKPLPIASYAKQTQLNKNVQKQVKETTPAPTEFETNVAKPIAQGVDWLEKQVWSAAYPISAYQGRVGPDGIVQKIGPDGKVDEQGWVSTLAEMLNPIAPVIEAGRSAADVVQGKADIDDAATLAGAAADVFMLGKLDDIAAATIKPWITPRQQNTLDKMGKLIEGPITPESVKEFSINELKFLKSLNPARESNKFSNEYGISMVSKAFLENADPTNKAKLTEALKLAGVLDSQVGIKQLKIDELTTQVDKLHPATRTSRVIMALANKVENERAKSLVRKNPSFAGYLDSKGMLDNNTTDEVFESYMADPKLVDDYINKWKKSVRGVRLPASASEEEIIDALTRGGSGQHGPGLYVSNSEDTLKRFSTPGSPNEIGWQAELELNLPELNDMTPAEKVKYISSITGGENFNVRDTGPGNKLIKEVQYQSGVNKVGLNFAERVIPKEVIEKRPDIIKLVRRIKSSEEVDDFIHLKYGYFGLKDAVSEENLFPHKVDYAVNRVDYEDMYNMLTDGQRVKLDKIAYRYKTELDELIAKRDSIYVDVKKLREERNLYKDELIEAGFDAKYNYMMSRLSELESRIASSVYKYEDAQKQIVIGASIIGGTAVGLGALNNKHKSYLESKVAEHKKAKSEYIKGITDNSTLYDINWSYVDKDLRTKYHTEFIELAKSKGIEIESTAARSDFEESPEAQTLMRDIKQLQLDRYRKMSSKKPL